MTKYETKDFLPKRETQKFILNVITNIYTVTHHFTVDNG